VRWKGPQHARKLDKMSDHVKPVHTRFHGGETTRNKVNRYIYDELMGKVPWAAAGAQRRAKRPNNVRNRAGKPAPIAERSLSASFR